ncbi:MAG: hypothetical protein WCV59_04515 [Parcubacteria group bacterium]|jgi:hypothetical protein
MPTIPFGKELADSVADRLVNCPLMRHHKEYSGRGFSREPDGTFIYGEVADGEIFNPILKFTSRDEFAKWLSDQSDASLSPSSPSHSDDNITRKRLEHYVKYSEKSTRGDF